MTLDSEDETVSVVIPFWNGSRYIERALDSVDVQSVKPLEVIVVDDGSSSEESQQLALLARQRNFTVVARLNGGQGAARNQGVSLSKGKYICFLDQDDYFLPTHIEKLLTLVDEANFGFGYGDLVEADGEGQIVSSRLLPHALFAERQVRLARLLRNDLFVLPSASIVSRDVFLAVGGFDERLKGYEDDDLFLRIYRAGYGYKFLDDVVTTWCIHTESTSWSSMMLESRWLYFQKLTLDYPDVWQRQIFYFRDSLVPRFEPKFLADLVMAKKLKPLQLSQARNIYKSFISEARGNGNVPRMSLLLFYFKYLFVVMSPNSLLDLAIFTYQRIRK